MGVPAGVMTGIGTAAQIGQGVASGAAGKRATGQAQQRQDQFDQRVGGMVDQATEALLGQDGQGGLIRDILGPGLGAGRDLFEQAGQAGQQYSSQMQNYQDMLLGGGDGMMHAGGTPGFYSSGGPGFGLGMRPEDRGIQGAFDVAGQLQGIGPQFDFNFDAPGITQGQGVFDAGVGGLQGPIAGQEMAADFGGQLGQPVAGTADVQQMISQGSQGPLAGFDLAERAGVGMQGSIPGMDIVGEAAQRSMESPQGYDFGPGRALQQQTMDTFQQQADAARATGMENVGQAFTGGQDALSAALASQGISPTSGVAAGALGEMAMQGAGQRAQLERDIAGAAGQTALQGAQFDVGSQLQREGMESGYGLGLSQLGLQGLGQAGNLGLGLAGQETSRLAQMGQLGLGMSQGELARLTGMGNLGLGLGGQDIARLTGGANIGLGLGQQDIGRNQALIQAGLAQTGMGQDFALGSQGLMSNFELARAGQQAGNLGTAGNLMLGAGGLGQQGDLARSAQQSQNIVNAANLARSGFMDPLGMQQDMFSQNIMNPFMAGMGGLQSLLGAGLSGMEQSLGRSERQAEAGGRGKGAAMGSAFDPARSQQKG